MGSHRSCSRYGATGIATSHGTSAAASPAAATRGGRFHFGSLQKPARGTKRATGSHRSASRLTGGRASARHSNASSCPWGDEDGASDEDQGSAWEESDDEDDRKNGLGPRGRGRGGGGGMSAATLAGIAMIALSMIALGWILLFPPAGKKGGSEKGKSAKKNKRKHRKKKTRGKPASAKELQQVGPQIDQDFKEHTGLDLNLEAALRAGAAPSLLSTDPELQRSEADALEESGDAAELLEVLGGDVEDESEDLQYLAQLRKAAADAGTSKPEAGSAVSPPTDGDETVDSGDGDQSDAIRKKIQSLLLGAVAMVKKSPDTAKATLRTCWGKIQKVLAGAVVVATAGKCSSLTDLRRRADEAGNKSVAEGAAAGRKSPWQPKASGSVVSTKMATRKMNMRETARYAYGYMGALLGLTKKRRDQVLKWALVAYVVCSFGPPVIGYIGGAGEGTILARSIAISQSYGLFGPSGLLRGFVGSVLQGIFSFACWPISGAWTGLGFCVRSFLFNYQGVGVLAKAPLWMHPATWVLALKTVAGGACSALAVFGVLRLARYLGLMKPESDSRKSKDRKTGNWRAPGGHDSSQGAPKKQSDGWSFW